MKTINPQFETVTLQFVAKPRESIKKNEVKASFHSTSWTVYTHTCCRKQTARLAAYHTTLVSNDLGESKTNLSAVESAHRANTICVQGCKCKRWFQRSGAILEQRLNKKQGFLDSWWFKLLMFATDSSSPRAQRKIKRRAWVREGLTHKTFSYAFKASLIQNTQQRYWAVSDVCKTHAEKNLTDQKSHLNFSNDSVRWEGKKRFLKQLPWSD